MADLERGLKISELTTAEEVSSSDYVAIDNGLNTFKVSIANLNTTGAVNASHYADLAEASATDAQSSATSAATSAQSANSAVTLATTQLQSYVTAAETAATNAATSEANARAYANSDYVKRAKSWAIGGTDSRTGEDTDNAKYYSIVSGSCMHIAGESKDTAVASAASAVLDSLKSEGFAVGEQNGEPVSPESPYYNNSSKYWAGVSQAAAVGGLHPMGTCTFEMLPSIADSSLGDMWDIFNDFVTTSDFREGAGVQHYAGDNVYLTASDKWDVMAGNISSKQNRVLASTLSIGGQTITEVEPALHALSNGVADTQISTTSFTSYDASTTDKTKDGWTGTEYPEPSGSVVGTLSLINDISEITKVRIDNTEYTTYTDMPVKAGSIVTLFHTSTRVWNWNNYSEISSGETCYFVVPSDATGDSDLYIETTGNVDKLNLYYETGWLNDVTPVIGNPEPIIPPLTTGEQHKSLFSKISAMFSNIRKLWNTVGETDISSVGSTVTGAINNLNGKVKGWTSLGTKTGTTALTYDLSNYSEILVFVYLPFPAGAYTSMLIPVSLLSSTASSFFPTAGVYFSASTTQAKLTVISINGQSYISSATITVYAR